MPRSHGASALNSTANEPPASSTPSIDRPAASRQGIEAWEARAMAGVKRVFEDETARKANIPHLS